MLLHQLVTSGMLRDMGEYVDDDDATYVLSLQATQLWSYQDGLLLGENVFQDWDTRKVTKLDDSQVVTLEQARAALDPFIPERMK